MTDEWPTQAVPRSDAARKNAETVIIKTQHWKDIDSSKLAELLSPFFNAGWSVDAVIHALYLRPDGAAQPEVNARGLDYVHYRLSSWQSRDGSPLPAPTQSDSETASPRNLQRQVSDSAREAALGRRDWPSSVVPETLSQRSKAAESLLSSRRWSQLSKNAILDIVSPFFDAGWSVACILHALDTIPINNKHAPIDGTSGGLLERIDKRLNEWKDKQGRPKRAPFKTLTYEQWYERLEKAGKFDVREPRKSRTRVQYEAVRRAREADERRKRQRTNDRINEARERDQRREDSLNALYEITPNYPEHEIPVSPPTDKHERLIEGVSHLTATDPELMEWLRTLLDMEPENVTKQTATVTRVRMQEARRRASLAMLEQMSSPAEELSKTAQALAAYVMGAPDLQATEEVRDMWKVLRSAIRTHDKKRKRDPSADHNRHSDVTPKKWSDITDNMAFPKDD